MDETEDVDLASSDDMFQILVATDIHLGYEEKDAERGEDSFNTFEEILQIAQEKKVDFVLLGGDLFHDTKPSPEAIHKCLALLRKYCLGDRPVEFEFLSDQEKVFCHCSHPIVNYEDPNFNISIPVFSIHGNHDDPTGVKMMCVLDLLSTSGMMNYFSKWMDFEHVEIDPLLMRKGQSHLALYGLSHIKDVRLYRLFQDNKVKIFRPEEDPDMWFNLMVLHQNRANRGPKSYIPEEFLSNMLDLVIWGHEHDCRIEPELNAAQQFYVSQPGSSVATSLAEGEALQKKVGLLTIYKKNFKLDPIPLQTVRPFLFDSVCTSTFELDSGKFRPSDQVEMIVREKVLNMIEQAKESLTGHPKQPKLPLIRLRVLYEDEMHMFNTIRFAQKFELNVANPLDVLLMRKEKITRNKVKFDPDDFKGLDKILQAADEGDTIEKCVEKFFTEEAGDNVRLRVLSIAGLTEAITQFITKQDKDALDEIVMYQMKRIQDHLKTKHIPVDMIEEEIDLFHQQRLEKAEQEAAEVRTHLSGTQRLVSQAANSAAFNSSIDPSGDLFASSSDEDDHAVNNKNNDSTLDVADKVRGGGRGSRGGRRGTRAAATTAARAPRAPRGGGRASRGSKTVQTTLQDSFSTSRVTQPTPPETSRRTSKRSTAGRSHHYLSDSD